MSIDDKSEGSSEGGSSSRSSSSAATSSSLKRRSSSFSYRNSFSSDGLAWLGLSGVPNVRSRVGLYVKDGARLRADFHALYRVTEDRKKIKDKRKVLRKYEVMKHMRDRRKKAADGKNNGVSTLIGSATGGSSCVEVESNPSSFATYAHVRAVVLQDAARQAQNIYLSSSSSYHMMSDSDSDDDSHNSRKDSTLPLPKMVGVGLVSVYELISGSVSAYPALCIRALEALLDILQGQQPEALKNEPAHVIESLFHLLLRLSTSSCSGAGEMLSWPAASPLTGVACACLLALVVARGDSAMYLRAVTDILITSRHLATQTIQVPVILTYLQRSVHALLIGRRSRPDWFNVGVPNSACIDTFPVKMMSDGSGDCSTAITCDGHYLFLHNHHGMYKIGTGFGGTRKGHIYMHRPDCFPRQTGWLGFANGNVYYRPEGSSRDLMMIDTETLKISEVHQTSGFGWTRGAPFSDGMYIGYILPDRDDGFVVRTYNPLVKPIPLVNEFTLSLAVRCVQVFGNGEDIHDLGSGLDDEVQCIASGKDFTLVCNTSGRLFYSGKSSAVGMKGSNNNGGAGSGGPSIGNAVNGPPFIANAAASQPAVASGDAAPAGRGASSSASSTTKHTVSSMQKQAKWPELVISKWPRITSVNVGHEGHHAVLLADDGTPYFLGISRRGEDGEVGKVRRQMKAVKPKRMTKMEGHNVVHAACNHATSALVTKEGHLYLFGKDTAHAEGGSGYVSDLRGVHIQSVQLGKAHAVALSNKGHVYTFGINNKGQCGRDFSSNVVLKDPSAEVSSMAVVGDDDLEDEDCLSDDGADGAASEAPAAGGMCPVGRHRFYREHCMVCMFCHECTGYGAACVSSQRPDRLPGLSCGCGSGESGCSECGSCRACAEDAAELMGEFVDDGNPEFAAVAMDAVAAVRNPDVAPALPAAGRIMQQLACGKLQQEIHRRLEESRHRNDRRKNAGRPYGAGQRHRHHRLLQQHFMSNAPINSDRLFADVAADKDSNEGGNEGNNGVLGGEGASPAANDTPLNIMTAAPDREAKMTSLPPAMVPLPTTSSVVEVSCGQHHTVVLCNNGTVYSWGSNNYGQLGTGDLTTQPTPQLVRLPPTVRIAKVAAGSNHTVLLSTTGQIYTCGNHQKGQLGRMDETGTSVRGTQRGPWYCLPGLVPGIGPRLGRKATWIGASADTTYIKLDQSLISAHNLSSAAVVANASCLVLLPIGERSKQSTEVLAPGVSSSSSSSSPSHSSSSTRARCSSFSSTPARYRTAEGGVVEEQRSSSFSGSVINKRSGFVDAISSTLAGGLGSAFGSGGSVVGIGSTGSLCGAARATEGEGSSSNSSVAAVAGSGGGSNSSIASGVTTGADGTSQSTTADDSGWRVLVINRVDSTCRSFSSLEQIQCKGNAICLDPIYNVLWVYDPERQIVKCYNLMASEAVRLSSGVSAASLSSYAISSGSTRSLIRQTSTSIPANDDGGLRDVLSPELSLPVLPEVRVSRAQIALHLLACLDTLTWGYQQGLTVNEGDVEESTPKQVYTKEDYCYVTRFDSHGGGWGYSGHSMEAVRFMCDNDVLIGGYGLFGGRGEYTAKVKLYDIGYDGGEQEQEGELLAETDDVVYECPARQKYPVMFEEPVPIQARRWYVAWARITGPSSDCGSSGQSLITTEEQVIFYFKSSKKSNNGTDVNAGQIPQLLYRLMSPDGGKLPNKAASAEPPIPILSKTFFTSVSNDVFQSLLDLLGWAWSTLRTCVGEVSTTGDVASGDSGTGVTMLDLHRLVYICRACLRLLHLYVNQLYPNSMKGNRNSCVTNEKSNLVESVSDVRGLLRQMLSDPLPSTYLPQRRSKHRHRGSGSNPLTRLIVSVLEECHRTFVLCFHAFYPTGRLKWACLCDLLVSRDSQSDDGSESDRLLSAVLAALSSPSVKLRATFPILSEQEPDSSYTRPSPADNAALSTLQPGDLKYPLLVEHMTYKTQMSGGGFGCVWTFREVLERLLGVVCCGVRGALRGDRCPPLPSLVHNTCLLIAAAVAELAAETTESEVDACATAGRQLLITPSRFSRTSHNRSWSTGNGSPDALCFSVDRSGIMIAGACVYTGAGNYEYEMELLDESVPASDPVLLPRVAGSSERWVAIESVRGNFTAEDAVNDVSQIKFEKPVPIKEGVKYAIRLINIGGRTTNGDGGQGSVKGPDGTTFIFCSCGLSVNGTNHIRGQLPQLLYYSSEDGNASEVTRVVGAQQARSAVLSVVGSVVRAAAELCIMGLGVGDDAAIRVLASSPIITTLLPLLLSHVAPVALSDPRSAVSVLGLCQELVPHVAALNNLSLATQTSELVETVQGCHTTTSSHYATVESEHPYKPAAVVCYRVTFPSTVQWMTLEFDPQSSLAQPEDILVVLIPNMNKQHTANSMSNSPSSILNNNKTCSALKRKDCSTANGRNKKSNNEAPAVNAAAGGVGGAANKKPQASFMEAPPTVTVEADDLASEDLPYWPVLPMINSVNKFPERTIIIPGNELVISMETASDYLKDERGSNMASKFGFSARVIGFEWPPTPSDAVKHLEKELSYLGGLCAASLIKKELKLPPVGGEEFDEELEGAEEIGEAVVKAHPALLSKGFALSHPPTIHHALDGVIPFSCHSNERLFLRDLVSCSDGTSGGRLARWLQPDSYVDVRNTEVIYSRDDLRANWPAIVTIITRDQYNEVVTVPNLKVEVVSVPVSDGGQKNKVARRLSQNISDSLTFGGHPQPSLDVPYSMTIREKMCYSAITMMKAYERYSFEELRLVSPALQRPTERMLVRSNGDGSYTCNWSPGAPGCYSLHVTIDGYLMDKTHKLEVRDPPQGMVPPVQNALKKQNQMPSKLRKFVLPHSAGLRVRSHPSLQSEQIGLVKTNDVIAFIDEVHNSDGVWLRLSHDCMQRHCTTPCYSNTTTSSNKPPYSEAWVLQYHQHLGKTLLIPQDEPKSLVNQIISDTGYKKRDVGTALPDIDDAGYFDKSNIRAPRGGSSRVEVYTVVKCGASGHNIRSEANLRAPPVGMLVQGNVITTDCQINNSEGSWVRLDSASTSKYCFTDGEAWSLAESRGHTLFLQWQGPYNPQQFNAPQSLVGVGGGVVNGFDFSAVESNARTIPSFIGAPYSTSGPFVFGANGPDSSDGVKNITAPPPPASDDEQPPSRPPIKDGMGSGKFSALNRWLRDEANKSPAAPSTPEAAAPLPTATLAPPPVTQPTLPSPTGSSSAPRGDLPQELQGVSVRELVKAIGESRANGNGTTPPRTPPPTPRKVPRSRSASPRVPPGVAAVSYAPPLTSNGIDSSVAVTVESVPDAVNKSRTKSGSSSPLLGRVVEGSNSVSGTTNGDHTGQHGGSSVALQATGDNCDASDTSALVSSITQDMSQSGASGVSSLATSTPNTPRKEPNTPKHLTQSATQTSPENNTLKFSIGSNGSTDEALRLSPKTCRKERPNKQSRCKRERITSPSPSSSSYQSDKSQLGSAKDKIKEAMSPSVAECMRAVFAAFLWHEGIVHDAMACASFLKFHPDLTKMAAFQWKPETQIKEKSEAKLTKEQKARQRHSVEVSAYSYLNVTPQNTDDLLKPNVNTTNMNEISRETEEALQHPQYDKRDDELVASWMGYQANCSQKLATVLETGSSTGDVPELPLVLRHVVLLWEELTNSCMKAIAQQMVQPSTSALLKGARKSDRTRDRPDKDKKHKHKKKVHLNDGVSEDDMTHQDTDPSYECELCGSVLVGDNRRMHFPSFHPGCGEPSHGCGFVRGEWKPFADNSHYLDPCGIMVNFCYRMCWNCRRRYKTANKGKGEVPASKSSKEPGSSSRKSKRKTASSTELAACKLLSPMSQIESHIIMRNNAMFLLDLASAASSPTLPQRIHRRSPCPMTGMNSDLSLDSSPFPQIEFQCLHTLNCQQQHLNQLREDLFLHQTLGGAAAGSVRAPYGRSSGGTPISAANDFLPNSSGDMHRDNSSYSPSNISQHQDSSGSDSDIPRPANMRPLNRSISVTVGTGTGQDWGTVATAAVAAAAQESMEGPSPTGGPCPITSALPNIPPNIPPSDTSSIGSTATVVLRKRNNSSGEQAALGSSNSTTAASLTPSSSAAGTSSLLVHPSTWLERLASSIERGTAGPLGSAGGAAGFNNASEGSNSLTSSCSKLQHQQNVVGRPVMSFIFQHHDLETLAYTMRHATRKAAARVYGMQAFNWLLRSVTQPTALHDLLWAFVSALKPQQSNTKEDSVQAEDPKLPDHQNNRQVNIIDMGENDMVVLDHPLSDVTLAGDAVHPLPSTFHQLLQTVADLMMLLPPGEPLQMMAVRCFGLRFTPADHDFLHQSHVFSNISKILSLSEEVLGAGDEATSMYEVTHPTITSVVERLVDLTSECELKTSSRQAMVASLTDFSTETFWESGDEDRNKLKTITVTWAAPVRPVVIYIHIDNVRDLGNRVTGVVFRSCIGEETTMMRQLDPDSRFTGWLHMVLEGTGAENCVLIELKGPDQCVRVRQVRVLGGELSSSVPPATVVSGADSVPPVLPPDVATPIRGKLIKQKTAMVLQHRECEQETLKVFRLITGQVFGKLIRNSESGCGGSVSGALSSSMERAGASSTAPSAVGGASAIAAPGVEAECAEQTGSASAVEVSEDPERNNDLREHVVGILFSRSKLTHLQKQVCAHIVQAIKRESVRAREEWESSLLASSQNSWSNISTHNKSPSDDSSSLHVASGLLSPNIPKHTLPDTYCFEMLSMVLALSGSPVGRMHLAHQDSLLRHLLSLLHTGSARVQRQVVSLFRRILSDISPRSLASLLGVDAIPDHPTLQPPTPSPDSEAEYDMHKQGILDVFLAVIAKALTVQLKQKGSSKQNNSGFDSNTIPSQNNKNSLSSATLLTCLPPPEKNNSRWWLQGTTTQKLADLIINLIRDMTHGKISEIWARVSKGAIAENIINLTRLDESYRSSLQSCLSTPTLWLALASLCVLHHDHVDALSSTNAPQATTADGVATEVARPTCDNHDDGETIALVQCDECGQLCGECDRVLHLHRRRRQHHRTILRHQQQAIKVDLHEGCGRTKLFWLLALADSTTLKALIELRSEGSGGGGLSSNDGRVDREGASECRFCGSPAQMSLMSPTPVCSHPDCQEYSRDACTVVHDCGHVCGGIRGETQCLPCLHGCSPTPTLRQDADDMCMICFSEALAAAPAIQLECGHVFHGHCCKTVLAKKWPGPRITFAFSLCPICKVRIQHVALAGSLAAVHDLYEDVRRKALMRLEYEGLGRPETAAANAGRNHQDLATYAMERYAYYVCYKCKKAYYGGEARCDAEAGQGDDYDPTELVCGACSDVSRAQMCPKHGTDFLEYKCRYCCSVAVFFCFGTTHFCNACHDDFQRVTNIPKNSLPHCPAGPRSVQLAGTECPLHVQHPSTGEEFALGCGVCRNAHTF